MRKLTLVQGGKNPIFTITGFSLLAVLALGLFLIYPGAVEIAKADTIIGNIPTGMLLMAWRLIR